MARLAIQMYTVRHQAEADLPGTLNKLRDIGYRAVESGELFGRSAKAFRDELDAAGLELCGTHCPLPGPKEADERFDELAVLGAPAVFPSMPATAFAGTEGVAEAARQFNVVVPVAERHGIELGYHNHWWEFSRLADRLTAYSRFVELLDPRVSLEVDTYWAQVGGADAAELVRSLGDRVHYLHIKDGPINKENREQVAVGDGAMDVAAVLRANAAVRWHVVELDDFSGDIWDAVQRSFSFLTSSAGMS